VNCCVLVVYAHEVDERVRRSAGEKPDGLSLAAAVREFLVRHQPWLAERVEVKANKDCAVVVPRGGQPSRNAEELLRAVQAVLGMSDKLPEVGSADGLPEIEFDAPDLSFHGDSLSSEDELFADSLLQSRVRHFPLPNAEWFEICEGRLFLTPDRIVFEPRYVIGWTEDDKLARRHEIPLSEVLRVARDTWFYIPCLRVETARKAYRFGWPPKREDIWSEFSVEEWLATIESALSRRGQL
jgi:hypothetical protein